MQAAARLRPRGVGDILDETIRIYRRNFVTMIAVVAIVVVPFSIIQFAFGLWWSGYGAESFTGLDFGDTTGLIRLVIQFSLVFFVALVYLFLISALVPGAVARVTAGDILGPPVGLGQSYRLGWRNIWSLSWAQLMVGTLYAALLVVLLTCIGVPVAVPALAFFATRWAFVLHCCVLERNRTIPALERSWRLVNNQFWHSLLVLTLLYIFAGVVMVILPGAFNFALSLSPPLPVALTTATNAMLNAATTIFVLPIVIVGMTVLYYDLRVRREGLDLVIALTELEEAQTAKAEAAARLSVSL